VDLDQRNPRVLQGAGAALVLLGFVADVRVAVPLAALGLLAAYALHLGILRPYRVHWIAEVALLAVASVLLFVGRAGWTWVLALLAAGMAAMAAIADVWVAPELAPRPGES
jgi:hypothetical protein